MENKPDQRIPFHDFGGEGKLLHFAHANGYPPESYQQFIQPFLAENRVLASKFRPLWDGHDPSEVKSWNTLADDLIRFLDQQGLKQIIGMGHSMGGTISVIAALKRPDLFRELILVDPVIFPRRFSFLTKFIPRQFLKNIIPPAKISQKRRFRWDSKEEVYRQWRKKKVFRRFSDQVLHDFVDHAIIPSDQGGVTLAFSREWETQIYLTAPYIFSKMLPMKLPTTVVRGQHTNVINPELWKRWKAAQPHNRFIDFADAGHLVPFEYPRQLADLLK